MLDLSNTVSVFSIVAVIILIGFAGDQFFKRTKVPSFIFLILLGVIIGPILNLFSSSEILPAVSILGELTLVMVLFYGGMDIDLKTILSGGIRIIVEVFLYVTISIITITAATHYFLGWSVYEALIFASIIGGETSAAVIIPLSRAIGINEKSTIFLTLESALNSVVLVILFFTFLQLYQTGAVSSNLIIDSLASSFSIGIFIGGSLSLLWIYVLKYFKKHRYTYVLTLGLLLGTFSITTTVGGSGLLSVVVFGIVLGNHKFISSIIKRKVDIQKLQKQLSIFQGEISFLLETFFFVFLGMVFSISLSNLIFGLEFGALMVGILLLTRTFSVTASTFGSEMSADRKAIIISCAQGLTVATLALLSLQYAIPNADTFVVLATYVIILTNVVTTIGTYFVSKGKLISYHP